MAKGSILSGGVILILRPVNLLASILLLRWLRPEDFGTVALAMLLFSTSILFSGLGMDRAIIHSQLDKRKTAFHAFVMMMGFALLLFVVVFTNLQLIADFLGDAELVPVLKWLSFLILLNTASTIPTSLLRKDLRFDRVALITLVTQLTYTAVSLTLALLGFGLWSLVYARLTSAAVKVVISWFLSPGWDWIIPKRWEKEVSLSLLRFGLQSTWGALLNYIHTHWDDWLVGTVMGQQALGFYSKAYDLTNKTMTNMSQNVIGVVFFPSYAKIQDNKERLLRAYLKSATLVLLLIVPMALGTLFLASELVSVLWGSKWLPMVPVLQIYAFMVLTRPISVNTSPLFLAVGLPNYNSRASIVLVAVMFPLAFLLFDWGIEGVATAVTVSHLVGALYNIYQVNKILPGSAAKTFSAMVPVFFSGGVMGLAVYLAKAPVLQLVGVPKYNTLALIIIVSIGAVVYLTATFITQRALVMEMWNLGLSIVKPKLRLRRA